MTASAEASHRLFVAVPVPARLKGFVRAEQELLPRSRGLRLLEPEQSHVTLVFIGRAGERELSLAREIVESVPAHMGGEVLIGGFMFIPSAKRARVIALGMEDEGGVLRDLHAYLAERLDRAGVAETEKRQFKPHLTVARVRTPGRVQPTSEGGREKFAVESVCLYESDLRREGATYTVLARTALDGAGARLTS